MRETSFPHRWVCVALFVGVLATLGSAKDSDYYYYAGRPFGLERVADHVGVELKAGHGVESIAALRGADSWPIAEKVVMEIPRRRRFVFQVKGDERGRVAGGAEAALARDGRVQRTFPVFRNPKTGLLVFVFDEIIVRLRPGVDEDTFGRFNVEHGLSIVERNRFEPDIYLLRVEPGRGPTLKAANDYARSGLFVWAEPNFGGQIHKCQVNDPYFPQQWHLDNTGQGGGTPDADVNAVGAWAITTGAPSVVIAVFDDGCDMNHQDLAANIFTNPGESGGGKESNGIDDDGNGYIDDVRGWDFYDNDNDAGHAIALGSEEAHGTATSGIAAAVGNNATGVTGMAYQCRIVPIKIFRGSNFAGDYEVGDALRYAATLADVLSNSWGGGVPSENLESAFRYAVEHGRGGRGCPLFFAAGNSAMTEVEYPSTSLWTIAVGASDRDDVRFSYSSHGTRLTVLSPSGNFTTDRTGLGVGYDDGAPDTTGNYTAVFGGTSSACPLAAGVGALMIAVNPNLSPIQIQSILQLTADKVNPDFAMYNSHWFSLEYGYGRIDAQRAVSAVQLGSPLDDLFEPNDTRSAAATVEKGFFSALAALDDDWFALNVASFQDISADIYFVHARGDLQLELYNPAGTLVVSSLGTANTERVETNVGTSGGTWYFRVFGNGGATNHYHLIVNKRPPDDVYEQNDSVASAVTLNPGIYRDLRCYDLDFFRVHVPSGRKIVSIIRFPSEEGDLDLFLYDSGGTTVSVSATLADVEGVYYENPGAGADVLIQVLNFMDAQNTYDLEIAVVPVADDVFEQNDFSTQAAVIGPGVYTQLQALDEDWYRITAGASEVVEAEIRFYHVIGDLDLYLYDTGGSPIDVSAGIADSERVVMVNTGTTPATAYLAVDLFSSTGFPFYTLTVTRRTLVDDAYEQNDTFASRALITPGTYGDLVTRDLDFYGFAVTQGKNIAAVLTDEWSLPATDLTLYSPTGISLGTATTTGPAVLVTQNVPVAGTYVARVRRGLAITQLYGLSVFVYDQRPSYTGDDSYEPNNSRGYASAVSPGAFSRLFCSNSDFFKTPLYEGDSLYAAIVFDDTSGADLDLYLYDPWGQLLTFSEGTANAELCVVEKAAIAGDYYVEVWPYAMRATYDLFIGRAIRGQGPSTAARHWELY